MTALLVFAPGAVAAFLTAYLVGSIPSAYIIVRVVSGEDVTTHGSGNVGAMNVRRTTGSWSWFGVAMVADLIKGVAPVAVTKLLALGTLATPVGIWISAAQGDGLAGGLIVMAAVTGAVLGHNYSVWMALIKRHFGRTGKGLATGAGTLLAYDWRYFVAVVVIGLTTIAITRYMMAGQVIASFTLPIAALALRSPDWLFALGMGLVVYGAHHKRFVGMLRGQEPKLYIHDRGGPRG
ncbi:MAG: glycerol-3-phosphate acyltransferase [Coriobacteriia bacterium]|nr:glycerol-3-phosphate acyltransferase [Coriobacteriia bacterium]